MTDDATADATVLAGIEQRVLAQVGARLSDITNHFGAYLGSVIRETLPVSGGELVSDAGLNTTLNTILSGARARIEAQIRAGYRAGGAAARSSASADLRENDFTIPPAPPPDEDSAYLAAILATIPAAFAVALADILTSVRTAYDGVTGLAEAAAAARVLTTHGALDRAVRRLGVRVRSAATVAVNRGYSDAQQTAYAAYAQAHPSVPMFKRWQTTSPTPCPSCRALRGATIPIDDEFDTDAGASSTFRPPAVFRNLLGPPRHPNCRCRLIYLTTAAGTQIQAQAAAPPPAGTPSRLTASGVRAMPNARFTALLGYFTAAVRRLTGLLRRRRNPPR